MRTFTPAAFLRFWSSMSVESHAAPPVRAQQVASDKHKRRTIPGWTTSLVIQGDTHVHVFLSHASADKPEVEAVGSWLCRRDSAVRVWIDRWSLVPGDSLVDRINDAISDADRLVVFLTEASIGSNWVRKEAGAGIVLEAAKQKGFQGENFVIPVYFKPLPRDYRLPPLLAAKLYANFVEAASFDEACEELYRGITGTALGPQNGSFTNLEVRWESFSPRPPAKYGIRVTFLVRLTSEAVGFHVDVGSAYDNVRYYFGSPRLGGVFTGVFTTQGPKSVSISIGEPRIQQGKPFVIELSGKHPFSGAPSVSMWAP